MRVISFCPDLAADIRAPEVELSRHFEMRMLALGRPFVREDSQVIKDAISKENRSPVEQRHEAENNTIVRFVLF